eukprot:COSAG04_NODE_21232_length_377_cov_1.474820_1_plen_69_part_01
MGRYHDWQCDGCARRASELKNASDYKNGHPRAFYYRLLNYATEHGGDGEDVFADVLCYTCYSKNRGSPH